MNQNITTKNIAIAILNYNGAHFLRQFLPSVIHHSDHAEIIVIDNASTDDSVQCLEREFPSVKLIKLEENFGFCGGYNRGLKHIDKPWVVLLNSDVEVTKDWLLPLVNQINLDTKLAALQPKILSHQHKNKFDYAGAAGGFIDVLGYPFCRGRVLETIEEDNSQYNFAINCFWASGACLLIRKDLYESTGGLDEDFFAHMEEIDLCWRLQRMGYTIAIQPQSVVYHVGGGTLSKINPRKTYLNFRNGLELLVKNLSRWELLMILPIRIVLDWVAAVKFLGSNQANHAKAIVLSHLDFIKRLDKTIEKRKSNLSNYLPFFSRKPFSIVFSYYLLGKKKFNSVF